MVLLARSIRFFKTGLVTLQVLAVGVALWEAYKNTKEKNSKEPNPKEKKFAKGKRDLVDETSWESFPASDAPASNKFT